MHLVRLLVEPIILHLCQPLFPLDTPELPVVIGNNAANMARPTSKLAVVPVHLIAIEHEVLEFVISELDAAFELLRDAHRTELADKQRRVREIPIRLHKTQELIKLICRRISAFVVIVGELLLRCLRYLLELFVINASVNLSVIYNLIAIEIEHDERRIFQSLIYVDDVIKEEAHVGARLVAVTPVGNPELPSLRALVYPFEHRVELLWRVSVLRHV